MKRARYELGNYTLDREEMEWGRHNRQTGKWEYSMRMVWVLRKNGNIMTIEKTKEDMITSMMIYAADAMDN